MLCRVFVTFLLPLLFCAVGECQTPLVNVTVFQDGKRDENSTDVMLAALSHDPAFRLVEREQLAEALRELQLSSTFNDRRELALGRLLSTDLFVFVTLSKSGSSAFRIVSAASGETFLQEILPEMHGPQNLETVVVPRVKAALTLLLQPIAPRPDGSESEKVSVILDAGDSEQKDTRVSEVASRLKSALLERGLSVLEREHRGALLHEQILKDRFFTESVRTWSPLQGARFILSLRQSVASPSDVELLLLDVEHGTRRRSVRISNEETGLAEGLNQILAAIQERRVDSENGASHSENTQRPELQEAEYQAVRDVIAQRGFHALLRFEKLRSREPRSERVRLWLTVLRRALFRGAGSTTSELPCTQLPGDSLPPLPDGVMILGTESIDSSATVFQASLTRQLAEATHTELGVEVFLPADLALLAREYDFLVGLKQTAGVTWREAPSLAVRNTFVATLDSNRKELTLILLKDLNPLTSRTVTFRLSDDQATIASQLRAAVKELNQSSALQPLTIRNTVQESEDELAASLDGELTRHPSYIGDQAALLKLLALNPKQVKYLPLFRSTVDMQCSASLLQADIRARLSPEDPVQGWLEFSTLVPVQPPDTESLRKSWQKITERYPNLPAAKLARLNLLLSDSDPLKRSAALTEAREIRAWFNSKLPGFFGNEILHQLEDWEARTGQAKTPCQDAAYCRPELFFSVRLPLPRAGVASTFVAVATFSEPEDLLPEAPAASGARRCDFSELTGGATGPALEAQFKKLISSVATCKKYYRSGPRTAANMEGYYGMALALFKERRYELSEELLSELVAWKDENGRSPDPELRANAMYLTALLQIKNGNLPAALAQSHEALQVAQGTSYHFLSRMRGWDSSELLEARVQSLIDKLRFSENASFVSPFE